MSAVWWLWSSFTAISRAPGLLVREDPVQELLPSIRPPISHGDWSLKPLARYEIKARVLSKESYSTDPVARLAPYDLALGWGRMSDSAVLDELNISQRYRRYQWQCWVEPPIPAQEITAHSANVHIIPASEVVGSKVRSLRKGALVRMTGYLVEATSAGQPGQPWTSSLERGDSGDGACEIMYVQTLIELD